MDPQRFREDLAREEVQDQIEAADVLLASRPDLASAEQLKTFDDWAQSLFPAKRHVGQVEQGRIPLELLSLVSERSTAVPRAGHTHGTDHKHDHDHDHDHDHSSASNTSKVAAEEIVCSQTRPIVSRAHHSSNASTVGWICWGGLVFDAKRISSWLNELFVLPGALRIKAVLRSNDGWCSFNYTDGIQVVRHSGHRRDSRLEIIFEGNAFPDVDTLEQALRMRVIEFRTAIPSSGSNPTNA